MLWMTWQQLQVTDCSDNLLHVGDHGIKYSFPGHEVVRLPVSHCTLNPIELAWAQVKDHIKANAKAFNLTEVEQLAWEGFGIVTADRRCKLIKHMRDKVEDHYWTSDGLYEQYIRQFVIQFGSDSESDTASS